MMPIPRSISIRQRRFLLWALTLVVLAYCGMCAWIYFKQQEMLFPAHYAPSVSRDWKPTAGGKASEAFLEGSCGKLHAALWEVKESKGVVMIFHGNAENLITVEQQVADFHGLGYDVAAWDYPGYGRSSRCWFDEQDLLADAERVYGWLTQQVKGEPIILYGRSIGSGLALYIASRHPVHKVLLVSPYDSLVNVGKDHMPAYIPVEWLILYPLDATQWIGKVQAPIHAIHGLQDTVIIPERAESLMVHAGENAEITWVDKAGHRASELFDSSNPWLEKHL